VTHATVSREQVLEWLEEVRDPEVPVLSVIELGIVRDVELTNDATTVVITPTYSGCPAMRVIEDEIVAALDRHGLPNVRVRTVYSPAWTTDWMGEGAKAKLEAYGIAPPGRADSELVTLRRSSRVVRCPYCKSLETVLQSEFGATACKAIYTCSSCRQPFELFKAI
jgi:ring-1,2-phenylacetyl-CoA epoxidase subunit PaaD